MADRPRILIVEDDAVARDTYRLILAAEGYLVSTAADPQAALAEMKRSAPHAIVLDLHLPGASGVDLLREIRRSPAHPSVAIVTADYLLDETIPEELERLGAKIWFKPLWDDDLIRLAADLVAGKPGRAGRE